jgi:hypothetical protein
MLVAVAEEREGQTLQLTLVLADGEQVGEQLARVEVVAERVDHRNGRAARHLLQARLRVGAPHDAATWRSSTARGVGRRPLPPSWLLAVEMISGDPPRS